MRSAFNVVLLAAGVAGCAGTTLDDGKEKEQQPKEAFPSFTSEWRAQGQPASSALAGTAAEQKEFEDWRAWQEWRRNNPK